MAPRKRTTRTKRTAPARDAPPAIARQVTLDLVAQELVTVLRLFEHGGVASGDWEVSDTKTAAFFRLLPDEWLERWPAIKRKDDALDDAELADRHKRTITAAEAALLMGVLDQLRSQGQILFCGLRQIMPAVAQLRAALDDTPKD